MIGLTLAAFALRLALARGDLWGDEAASVTMSLRPVRELLATLAAAEPHPPLYPLLLKAWLRAAGTDEVVARFPSVAAGTALVPVVVALGRLAHRRVGLAAGLLVATSPFLIWYATEARMYPLATLGAAASCYWLARLLRTPRWSTALIYGVAAGLALLSHYFVLFVGLAQAIVALAAAARRPRLVPCLALGGALALAPAAIWALYARQIVGSYYGAAPGTVDLFGIATSTWQRLPVGWSVAPGVATTVGLAATPLVLLGAGWAWRRAPGRLWLAWLVVPFLAAMVVSIWRPMYQARYLSVVAPAYLLALAGVFGVTGSSTRAAASARPPAAASTRTLAEVSSQTSATASTRSPATASTWIGRAGISAVAGRRLTRAALLAGALGVAGVSLAGMASPRYARSQYGSHAAEANALGGPSQAVVLTGPSQAPLYEYYASRNGAGMPIFGLPEGAPAPEPATSRALEAIAGRFEAVWLFLYAVHDYDPADIVERWLTEHTYRAPPRWTINGRLIRFATERAGLLGPTAPSRSIGQWQISAALPAGPTRAGQLVPVRIVLRPDAPVEQLPKLRLRLSDAHGFLWGEADEVLGAGFATPASLAVGRDWLERRAVAVLAGAPTGTYRLEAALYVEGAAAARELGAVELGTVAVVASDRFWAGQIPDFHVVEAPATGGWSFVGWAGAPSRRTGERAYLTTVWRAGVGARPLDHLVRFVGPDGQPSATRTVPLGDPTVAAGQVIRVQMAPPVGLSWPPGRYGVTIALRDPADGTPLDWPGGGAWRPLFALRVEPGEPPPPAAEPEVASGADFGGIIQLRGYTPQRSPFGLTLHWQALADVDRRLAVFVHLVDERGAIRAQSDGAPADGRAPTDGWSRGDRIDDRRVIAAPPGRYRVLIGLYDPVGGERLPTRGPGATGDAVDLGWVSVDG